MDFQTKRQSKKYAKLYFRTAWYVIIAWMLFIVACVVALILAPKPLTSHDSKGDFWIMLLFISPIFIGLIFAIFGQYFLDKRTRYKRMIIEFRQRRFFQQIMEHLRVYELSKAIDVYDELLRQRDFRKFVYPIIITKLIDSTNENEHKQGLKLLNGILEKYSPADVNFNS